MQNKTWNKLLEFESRDLIERFLRNKYDRNCSERQVMEISSNFIQAREYFKNAQQAAITVKPLLQYYGVTSLTRGLILAMSPHLSESALKPAHGLETKNWQETLSKKDFGNLIVNIRQGTLYDFLKATSNKCYFKNNSSAVNWHVYFDLPPLGAQIKFIDLIQTFSDFSEEFEIWTQCKLNFMILNKFKTSQPEVYEYGINKNLKSESTLNELFPKHLTGDYSLNENSEVLNITTIGSYTPHFSQRFTDPFNAGIGEIALTKPINEIVSLNSIAGFYTLSFFLGMISRYFPSIWISLGRTEKGDAIFPLFIKIIETIENHFPTLILDYLNSPHKHEIKDSNI